MPEQTQTEKLRGVLKVIVEKRKTLDFEEYCVGFDDYGIADDILKACKEAGLRFVGNKGDVLFGEEIEIN